jgi:predicted nucleotidyltransferase component of viral defense system
MPTMTIFDEMVAAYSPQNAEQRLNAQHQTMQQIVLAGLHKGGFFEHAAFYGGTCLRIFHNLPRFSEDMDFSLTEKNPDIHLENYFQAIQDVFAFTGKEVVITKKEKLNFGRVESAFLKEDTSAYDIAFRTEKTIKVKIELDTNPPLLFDTEQKLLMKPYSLMVRCFTLPDLSAGKMHALVYRNWKTRIKGRDWYDFEWYIRNNVPLNYVHLQERIREFSGQEVSKEEFMQLLRERLATADINQVKQDVLPFVDRSSDLDIWSNEYFGLLADRLTFVS